MKLEITKITWLTILLSAFFISCTKKDDVIGLKLQEEDAVFSHYLLDDALDWNISGKLENTSLLTSGVDLVHVGAFSDTYAGKVSSKTFLQIGLASGIPDFTNAFADTAILRLSFNSSTISSRVLQGILNGDNKISVHRMTEAFVDSISYSNDKSFDYEPLSLGELVYSPSQETVYIEIGLRKSFAQELIDLADSKTKTAFIDSFFGLVLVPHTNDQSIVAFDINSGNSYLQVKYNGKGVSSDYYFDLSTSNRHLVSIESNRSSSIFSPLSNSSLLPTSSTNNLAFIENGIGASLVINFGDIASLLDTTKNLVINKAVIRLPLFKSSYSSVENEPVKYLKMYECDPTGKILLKDDAKKVLVPDYDYVLGTNYTYFQFNTSTLSYELDLTYYFQEYILNKRELNSVLITPNIITSEINYQARTNRSIIDVSKATFKIYYSNL